MGERLVNRDPLRRIIASEGYGRERLECGHIVTFAPRYNRGRTIYRQPPTRRRCYLCGNEAMRRNPPPWLRG